MKTKQRKAGREIIDALEMAEIRHPSFPKHLNGVSPLTISPSQRRKRAVTGENGPSHGMILVCGNVYTVITTSYWKPARVESRHPLLQVREYHPEEGAVTIDHKRGLTPDQFEDVTGVKIKYTKR